MWTRRQIAERWGVPVPAIDWYIEHGYADEVALEVRLSGIEAEYRERRAERQRKA